MQPYLEERRERNEELLATTAAVSSATPAAAEVAPPGLKPKEGEELIREKIEEERVRRSIRYPSRPSCYL